MGAAAWRERSLVSGASLTDGRDGGGQCRIPVAGLAGVLEGAAREREGGAMRVLARGERVVLEQVLAEAVVPAGLRRIEAGAGEPGRRGMRVGVEGCARMACVARPPADGDLLRVHRVARDEVL